MNQKHQQELQQSFNQLTEIAEEVFLGQKASDARHGIDLLEIYAGTQSPLTDAVREMGGTAIRFTGWMVIFPQPVAVVNFGKQ